jgi:FkbM family methyltransferase
MNSEFMRQFVPYLKGNKVAIQSGGNCGFVTKQVSEYFDYTYTFEPDTKNFLALCLNVPDKNVYKIQSCLGEKHKMVKMVTKHPFNRGSGANYVDINNYKESFIPTLKIDDLGLPACDFIQLDIEGYEYFALLGGEVTIKKYHPLLCLEVAHRENNRN